MCPCCAEAHLARRHASQRPRSVTCASVGAVVGGQQDLSSAGWSNTSASASPIAMSSTIPHGTDSTGQQGSPPEGGRDPTASTQRSARGPRRLPFVTAKKVQMPCPLDPPAKGVVVSAEDEVPYRDGVLGEARADLAPVLLDENSHGHHQGAAARRPHSVKMFRGCRTGALPFDGCRRPLGTAEGPALSPCESRRRANRRCELHVGG